jgi:hypothetical protein
MPIKIGIVFIVILLRFIAASIPLTSLNCQARIAIGDLHPVEDVDVVRRVASSVVQHAFAGHLLLVRREGAGQGVRLP